MNPTSSRVGPAAPPLTGAEKAKQPSLWHRSLTHYRTPDGHIVPLWNGHALYYAWRAQQKERGE